MKKTITILFSAVLFFAACNQEPAKKINVEGAWKFEQHIEGKAELNAQSAAMINSIVSLFKDGEVEFKEGNVNMKGPVVGNRKGTYTVKDGKLDVELGKGSQFSLHVKNEGANLIVLFNEDGDQETGKIVLVKK